MKKLLLVLVLVWGAGTLASALPGVPGGAAVPLEDPIRPIGG
ncbi:hypothetical protein [Deinococcus carri]